MEHQFVLSTGVMIYIPTKFSFPIFSGRRGRRGIFQIPIKSSRELTASEDREVDEYMRKNGKRRNDSGNCNRIIEFDKNENNSFYLQLSTGRIVSIPNNLGFSIKSSGGFVDAKKSRFKFNINTNGKLSKEEEEELNRKLIALLKQQAGRIKITVGK